MLPASPPAAGQDRAFRAFSTIQDAQSRELSQHHTQARAKRLKIEEAELKLPPVLALDACDVSVWLGSEEAVGLLPGRRRPAPKWVSASRGRHGSWHA